jgi:hypothetical protein
MVFLGTEVFAQTGKISGQVTDAATGDPLPGVNVVIQGEQQGATTDTDGFYSILNVSPGTYTLRASFVGYAAQVVENVEVNIDLTTTVNFELQEEAVGLEEVTVQAQQPVVRPDVSANVSTLNSSELENIPGVTSISEVVGLQAGAEGLSIRGSGADELSMVVDGVSMRDGRTNSPFTGISYTSVDQVQVQTGGFNAEYGNVRSGLINVATREGPRNRYTVDAIARYSAPQKQHFGIRPDHPDAYWYRPYLDEDVAFVGTHSEESPWDRYTRQQYPEFDGWNAIAAEFDDLTPEQAQEVFEWNTRKSNEVTVPNYTVDASFGGPVPGISDPLGDLRFFASYRTDQDAFFVPMAREAGRQHLGQVKLTSNIASNMKLQFMGMVNKQSGYASGTSATNIVLGGWTSLSGRNQLVNPHYENAMDITRHLGGAEFTHTLGANTFYKARIQRMYSDYLVRPHRERNEEVQRTIGGIELTEAPWGFNLGKENTLSGLRRDVPRVTYDSSNVAVWTGSYDITSQLNRYSQLKGGVEYIFSQYNVDHFQDRDSRGQYIPRYEWQRSPHQGAAFLQNKLEFEGMIANVGLRLDYFDPAGTWYDYDPFTEAFTANFAFENIEELDDVERVETESQLTLSPRIGVSFPITTDSKLFFNYGHFRQMLDPMEIFQIEQDDSGFVGWIGNPNHPMPRTVAYELGYEHNLFNQFLIRATGYYKALDNQSRHVDFLSGDGRVVYEKSLPNNYEDIRGFEISLRKVSGRYVRGFVNYTYMAEKSGNFGFARYYQSPIEQREFERTSTLHYQSRPDPEPFARARVEFFTPTDFGPQVGGIHPLNDWRLSFLGSWRAGDLFTWDGGGGNVEGITDNVRWKDDWDLDMRLTRTLDMGYGEIQLFADIQNVLNLRQLERFAPFTGREDRMNYMRSLHLPESVFEGFAAMPYQFIPGDDEPGDYRKPGAEFQPIEVVAPGRSVENVGNPHPRPFYYEKSSGRYMSYENGSWQEVDQNRVDQVLEDKAYIDMPNLQYLRFLNPRRITFGLRMSF